MQSVFFLIVSATAMALSGPTAVDSKNGEFIFRQYPPRALAAGEQGSVRFKAEVDAKGNVLSCRVTAGSGFERLDRETCDMIVQHATFKPALDGGGKAREAVHDGIVNWRIPGMAPAAKIASIGGKSPDEIVCRRVTKTGSLIARSRVCMTRREWTASAEHNQDDWGTMQGRKGFSICGGPDLPPC